MQGDWGCFDLKLLVSINTLDLLVLSELFFAYYKSPPEKLLKKADEFMSKNPIMALLIIKDRKEKGVF